MFVGTGGVLAVCPGDGEVVRGAVDVPVGAVVAAAPDGEPGSFPQSDAVGVGDGAGWSMSIASSTASADAAAEGVGAAIDALDAAGGGVGRIPDEAGAFDTAGETVGATRPN